jgi:hypothetical protein
VTGPRYEPRITESEAANPKLANTLQYECWGSGEFITLLIKSTLQRPAVDWMALPLKHKAMGNGLFMYFMRVAQ